MPCILFLRVKTQILLARSEDGGVVDVAPLLEALFLEGKPLAGACSCDIHLGFSGRVLGTLTP